MKNRILLLISLLISLFFAVPVQAQEQKSPVLRKQTFATAEVVEILKEGTRKVGQANNLFQQISVRILDGAEKDKTITIEHGGIFTITKEQQVVQGEKIVLSKTDSLDGEATYALVDRYRIPKLLGILFSFFLLVLIIATRKGMGSILGLGISLAVIFFFMVPQILNGANPLLVSLVSAVVIMLATMYLAHGFSPQTSVAAGATGVSLALTALLAILFVQFARLSGLGTEDAYSLQQGFQNTINFQGLLLGGIIIGSLGVLDDVTTTQTATIFSLAEANPKFTMRQLFQQGMRIGREHIASLVNTLVLAYAGASIGVFIYLILGMRQATQPLWVMLNSELLAEEVIRTLAGSTGLVLAVPITTLLAAFFAKYSLKIS